MLCTTVWKNRTTISLLKENSTIVCGQLTALNQQLATDVYKRQSYGSSGSVKITKVQPASNHCDGASADGKKSVPNKLQAYNLVE